MLNVFSTGTSEQTCITVDIKVTCNLWTCSSLPFQKKKKNSVSLDFLKIVPCLKSSSPMILFF